MIEITPYNVYLYRHKEFVVVLSTGHSIPYLPDHVASRSAGVGVDITEPSSYDVWENACLCWNVLRQKHEFVHPSNLSKLEGVMDGYIPFDHATGRLKATLSLLKFAQDKLYQRKTFDTTLPLAKEEPK